MPGKPVDLAAYRATRRRKPSVKSTRRGSVRIEISAVPCSVNFTIDGLAFSLSADDAELFGHRTVAMATEARRLAPRRK